MVKIYDVNPETLDYDISATKKLIGTNIKHWGQEWYVKSHIEHFLFLVRDDGYSRMIEAKEILKDIQEKKKANEKLEDVSSLFTDHVLAPIKWNTMGESTYLAGITNDSNMPHVDNRAILFDTYYGIFGVGVAGFGPTGRIFDKLKDETEYIRIPRSEIVKYALNRFKIAFEAHLDLRDEICFHQNKLKDNDEVSFTFWNPSGKRAHKLSGWYHQEDWDKHTFVCDSADIVLQPTETTSGLAKQYRGNKITMSKSWELVPKSTVLDIVYEWMEKKIEYLFSAEKSLR